MLLTIAAIIIYHVKKKPFRACNNPEAAPWTAAYARRENPGIWW